MTKDSLIAELVKALEEVIAHSRQQADFITHIIPVTTLRKAREALALAKASAAGDGWPSEQNMRLVEERLRSQARKNVESGNHPEGKKVSPQ